MSDTSIVTSVELGSQWQTLDPFLFCAHHNDRYPPGDGQLGPSASLAGRTIGNDFSERDGWSMYHGSSIPGFPRHPHRGFETITIAKHGFIDHSDSLGATARFGSGDVQWMTAGGGIVHSEMFPLVDSGQPNHAQLLQIWLNLPASDKLVDPYFTMLWAESIPKVDVATGASVTVIAGAYEGTAPLEPPPNSWASREEADVAIWQISLSGESSIQLPPARPDSTRVIYGYEGDGITIDGHPFAASTGVHVKADATIELSAAGPSECLVLQGRPIGEPVAQYGPFVMNTQAEIQTAFSDFQRTEFGGWPWDSDDPAHAADRDRFAIHADGTMDHPA